MQKQVPDSATLTGRGVLRWGSRLLGEVRYSVRVNPINGQATVVEFDEPPRAGDGELVHLTLEDGKVVNCQVLDDSPYCAVVGDGPVTERRRAIRTKRY